MHILRKLRAGLLEQYTTVLKVAHAIIATFTSLIHVLPLRPESPTRGHGAAGS